MNRLATVALLALAFGLTEARAQDSLDTAYERAFLAWDRGEYVPALEGFARILAAPEGRRYFERIALVTGELYPTVEVAPDGHDVRFSPDGRWAAYEVGTGTDLTTHIVPVEPEFQKAAEVVIAGAGLVFAPSGGRVAYLAVPRSEAVLRAQEELARAVERRDRGAVLHWGETLRYLQARDARVIVRDLASGQEWKLDDGGLLKTELAWSADGRTLYAVAAEDGVGDRSDIYVLSADATPRRITEGPGFKGSPRVAAGGRHLVYAVTPSSPVPQRPGAVRGTRDGVSRVVVRDLATGREQIFDGYDARLSADGSTAVFLAKDGDETLVRVVSLGGGGAVTVKRTEYAVTAPALSPDGGVVAYAMMPREDWEVFLVDRDAARERRLTYDVQHDLYPQFVDGNTVLVVKGEGRHRRSYLYDIATGEARRLFHNNTIRTIAPEYAWAVSPDGARVLIVADRDGDTVSPERGVYLTDLTRTVSQVDVMQRISANLLAEKGLRQRGERMFAPIAEEVRRTVARVSRTKLHEYQAALFRLGSKHITQPGNRQAMDYLVATLQGWGYEPELQWFEPEPGVRTANVIARLRGTTHPELMYVVGSHFDSTERGPGADDNTSGTAVLLETARVLKDNPLPATVVFAFFTGEEAGLLGSREFTRRAAAEGWAGNVLGALNNDMIGYANDHRLDNTIRYSNAGIRDLQHAAAFLFTDLVTYDARYYKSTDAHALFDAFGDVVGGIGSYPVLANPHYHRDHDVLETINPELVEETAKANVASVMLLASSPARLKGLSIVRRGDAGVEVTWEPAREKGIREYQVVYGPPGDPTQRAMTVTVPRATLRVADAGWIVSVRAVDERGLAGWDWARTVVPE